LKNGSKSSKTQVEFEGPELVIYTDDPKRFADEADLIKILARDLRKRIVVRPTVLEDPEKAYNEIKAFFLMPIPVKC